MTQKRFTIPEGYRIIKDNVTNESAIFYDNDDGETFLKWLNELHKENQELKRQINNLEHTRDFCKECCEQLEKENQQLKSEIKKVQKKYEQLWMSL